MTSFVLVINSGSSSMKYQLVDPAEGTAIASGLIERIGGEGAATHKSRGESLTFAGPIPDHGAALTDHAAALRRLAAGRLPTSRWSLSGTGWCTAAPASAIRWW